MTLEPAVVFRLMGVEIVEDDMDGGIRISGGDLIHEVEELDASTAALVGSHVYKSGFDPTVNVRLRHSFNGGHDRRGGLDVVKDASFARAGAPVLCILDNIDPLAKLAAKR